jgi:hypothetical protein
MSRPGSDRSTGNLLRVRRGSGRAAVGTARIRRRPRQRLRALSARAGVRFVRWLHRSGRRRRGFGWVDDGLGGSPTIARARRSAVYAASALRVVMVRMVPHPDIADHPAACSPRPGTIPRTSEIPGSTWGKEAKSIPRMFRDHWHTAAYDRLRLHEPCRPYTCKRPGQRMDDLVLVARPAGFEPATVGLEARSFAVRWCQLVSVCPVLG